MIELIVRKTLNAAEGKMMLQTDFQIKKNGFVALYGKSGAGKTSILRMLAGLMKPETGKIIVNENVWFDHETGINLAPQNRKVGFVFQDYALFPNMTVKENLDYALAKNENSNIVQELIDIVELGELQNRKPETLSGGQKQRVALARSLVQKPELLLLDEPLSSLDQEIRMKLQDYIFEMHKKYGLTTIMVSHDVSEILKLSDNMMVLEHGNIINQGHPVDVFGAKEVSGKFQFTGEILKMEKQSFIFILTILIGNEVVKVVADQSEAETLKVGDKVLVASKAFNPIIKKIS